MGMAKHTASAARYVPAWALLCAVGVVACGSRPMPPSGSVSAVQLMPEERLGIDDVFEVRVFAEPDLSGAYRISADGTIDFPLIGRLSVIGMRSGDVQELITAKLKDGYLKNPQVSLLVKEWNSRKVSVMGQVAKPGAITYFPNMTIVDAIVAAGGFTAIASKNAVTLRREVRGGVESQNCPVADITEGRAPNVLLQPGDILVVEERLF
jgi:protein involved in polysaccharide export with SLBB domain